MRKIYEKRFKKITEILDSKDVIVGTEPNKEEFFRSMREDYTYMAVPDRIANKEKFIQTVKAFSDLNEESVVIQERDYELEAKFYLDMIVVSGTSKNLFVRLLNVSDEIRYIPTEDGMVLLLYYYTHEQFYKGEKCRFIM